MRPSNLFCHLPCVVEGRELRHGRGRSGQQKGTEETDVDTVLLESLVNTGEILGTVTNLGRTERSLIDHRQRTGHAVLPSGSTATARIRAKNILSSLLDG